MDRLVPPLAQAQSWLPGAPERGDLLSIRNGLRGASLHTLLVVRIVPQIQICLN